MRDPVALAARLVVGLAGPRLGAAEAAWLVRWRPAGIILFARNVTGLAQLRDLTAAVKGCLGPGAEIAVDHEGGPISVCAAAVGRPPSPWGLGLLDDPDLTRRVHAGTAARLRDAGVTRVLAPCADVLVEPRNPVIGVRAFGATPARVAAHVAAAVTGLRSEGLGVCLKHWPGHGGTRGDSHAAAVETGGGALDGPFTAGVAAGADAVMVGHLPDPHAPGSAGSAPSLPATLDPEALARLRGLAPWRALRLYADDVTMGALRPALAARGVAVPGADSVGMVDPADLTLAWLAAVAAGGCEVLLCRGIPWGALPAERPVPKDAPEPRERASGGGASERTVPSPTVPVYAEALRRLAVAAGDPFPRGSARLLWEDGTAGDRWGGAEELIARLRARFAIVPLADAPAPAADSALVVTSHRPLSAQQTALLRERGRLAAAGGCLAAGHPSLAADLRAALPPGWRISALPDLDPAGLDAWSESGA